MNIFAARGEKDPEITLRLTQDDRCGCGLVPYAGVGASQPQIPRLRRLRSGLVERHGQHLYKKSSNAALKAKARAGARAMLGGVLPAVAD